MNITKMKEMRTRKGLRLADLSKETGYTASYLSQLERGIKSPSLDALRKISDGLGIPMFELIPDDSEKAENGSQNPKKKNTCDVILKSKRKKTIMPQILTEYEFVTPYAQGEKNRSQVVGLLTTVSPGCMACEKMVSHHYEESVFIIKGSVRVYVADEVYELTGGDSIYIYAEVPNNFENCGDDDLILLGYARRFP